MTTLTAVVADRIFDGIAWFENSALLVENELVLGIVPVSKIPADISCVDYDGQLIVPGFIDLQVNGGGGVRFGAETSVDAIKAITTVHARYGTTKLLTTLITDVPEVTASAMKCGQQAHAVRIPGFLGLHLEGPHLSQERKGSHNQALIRRMTAADLQAICDYRRMSGFMMTTVAPENVTIEQVAALVDCGVVVSIGHSNATAETVGPYFKAGASVITHLFNAMSQIGNREPGIVGAALNEGCVYAGLIADGIHVNPATIRLAVRAKTPPGKIFLVTDAMQTLGTKLTQFELNGRIVERSGGILKFDNGTLVGSDIDMLSSVKFVHKVIGLSLESSLAMASGIPAQAAGFDHKLGFLKSGFIADFVVLNNRLDHVETWIDGKRIS